MFLEDKSNKMFRKIAFLIPIFLLCLGIEYCKSPEDPEEPEPNYEYRYNVEVIYNRIAEGSGPEYVVLDYLLNDPAESDKIYSVQGNIRMDKIGKLKYRGYLPKVFIQTGRTVIEGQRHRVSVKEFTEIDVESSSIDIQGAYDLEIIKPEDYLNIAIWVYFRMSK